MFAYPLTCIQTYIIIYVSMESNKPRVKWPGFSTYYVVQKCYVSLPWPLPPPRPSRRSARTIALSQCSSRGTHRWAGAGRWMRQSAMLQSEGSQSYFLPSRAPSPGKAGFVASMAIMYKPVKKI